MTSVYLCGVEATVHFKEASETGVVVMIKSDLMPFVSHPLPHKAIGVRMVTKGYSPFLMGYVICAH